MAEKTRYSDEELEEFKAIIKDKLEIAQRDYEALKASLMNADSNSTDDTSIKCFVKSNPLRSISLWNYVSRMKSIYHGKSR